MPERARRVRREAARKRPDHKNGTSPRSPPYTGSTAEGTVRFGLDGVDYEIDLNAGHSKALRDALARTWMRLGGRGQRPKVGPGQPARTAGGLNTAGVREWARAQAIGVKNRGRVAADLMVKFKSATGQQG